MIFPFLLLLAACIGHVALLILSHNWWYAAALSRPLNKFFRLTHAALMLAGLVLFALVLGLDPLNELNTDSLGPLLLTAYVVLCWTIAGLILPGITLLRLLRKPTRLLLSNHTRTLDVAAVLGYRPIGNGKYRHLARLPRNEVFQVDFAERTFQFEKLPRAWEGLSILHLSDLHMCGTPDREFYRQVIDTCNEWQPDLVALTGDVIDTDRHHRWIMPLLGRLKYRIAAFAILGNHDLWRDPPLIRRRLKRIGMHVLGNGWEQIDVRGQPMLVIGNEAPWFLPAPDLSTCPPDLFRLCLSHTPDNIRWARQNRIDLMLSGHVHGGQIRFPVLGSVFVPSRYSRRYDCGIFDEPPTLLHVTRGLAGEHPLRYNCRPEVVKIVLRGGIGSYPDLRPGER